MHLTNNESKNQQTQKTPDTTKHNFVVGSARVMAANITME